MFLEHSQEYLDLGFSVFPVTRTKKPAILWAPYQKQLPSAEELAAWSKDKGDCNIGACTGRFSDITVVDADSSTAIELIESLLPKQHDIPIVNTPRGRHYHFKYTPELRTLAGVAPGIDIRNDGGFVILPPSYTDATPDGKCVAGTYSWHDQACKNSRPPMPDALLKFLLDKQEKRAAKASTVATDGKKGPQILKEGTRDNELFHAALHFFKDGRSRDEVDSIILKIAKICEPPFPEHEALAKVESAWKRFQKNGSAPSTPMKTNIRCFKDIPKTPLRWLWEGRFPLNMLSLIAGQQGKGKSTFTVWMACRLSRGEDWPDCPGSGQPLDTVLITSEDPAEQIISYRIEANGGDVCHIHTFDSVLDKEEEFPFDINLHLPHLEQELEANPNIKLVVIDPLASHMGGNIDAHDMNRIRWSLNGLAKLAKRRNIAIIGIAHFKKDENVQDALNKIAGSYQFSSLPRAVWEIMEDRQDQSERKPKYFLPAKMNACQFRQGLSFFIDTVSVDGQETGKIVFEKDPPKYITADELNMKNLGLKMTKAKSIEDFITKFLADGPHRSNEDLGRALESLGFSPNTIADVKSKMRKEGKIDFRPEDGTWWAFLTSKPGRFGR